MNAKVIGLTGKEVLEALKRSKENNISLEEALNKIRVQKLNEGKSNRLTIKKYRKE
jgi:hypothetical protein